MFPLRDHHPAYKFALVTYTIITVNALVFFIELTASDPDAFIETYALVPALVNFSKLTTFFPFLTSQFLHAGFIHIISNMWFLKIFGDNVEDRFGKVIFSLVYLLSGVVGGLVQYIFSPASNIPMLGASGAVAGVLGAYLVFFPKNQIETLVPMGFISRIVNLPASFMLIYWFITQFFSGVGSIVYTQTGGVAFWAHVGGFTTGWVIAGFFRNGTKSKKLSFEGYDYVN